jgi:hypothetical protein
MNGQTLRTLRHAVLYLEDVREAVPEESVSEQLASVIVDFDAIEDKLAGASNRVTSRQQY